MSEGARVQFRLRAMFVVVALVAIFLAVWVNWPWVSSTRIYGVKIGMTEAEAIGVMGGDGSLSPNHPIEGQNYYRVWSRWFLHVAVVEFSPDGRVVDAFND